MIGTTADAAILSDRRTYGIWILFSVSVRVSRLLSDGPVGLIREASEFVEDHYLPPAILKVAELVGGIGLGTGFRSANRSVAGRASPALWGWGSALAGNPGSWCRRAALRPAGAGAAGMVGGRAVRQGWARGTGPAAVPRAASPATRSSAGNRRTWSGSARPGRNRAA